MIVICFNQNNIVPDGQNNNLVYTFPNSVQFKYNSLSTERRSLSKQPKKYICSNPN